MQAPSNQIYNLQCKLAQRWSYRTQVLRQATATLAVQAGWSGPWDISDQRYTIQELRYQPTISNSDIFN
jgi:hypothetical protein